MRSRSTASCARSLAGNSGNMSRTSCSNRRIAPVSCSTAIGKYSLYVAWRFANTHSFTMASSRMPDASTCAAFKRAIMEKCAVTSRKSRNTVVSTSPLSRSLEMMSPSVRLSGIGSRWPRARSTPSMAALTACGERTASRVSGPVCVSMFCVFVSGMGAQGVLFHMSTGSNGGGSTPCTAAPGRTSGTYGFVMFGPTICPCSNASNASATG